MNFVADDLNFYVYFFSKFRALAFININVGLWFVLLILSMREGIKNGLLRQAVFTGFSLGCAQWYKETRQH